MDFFLWCVWYSPSWPLLRIFVLLASVILHYFVSVNGFLFCRRTLRYWCFPQVLISDGLWMDLILHTSWLIPSISGCLWLILHTKNSLIPSCVFHSLLYPTTIRWYFQHDVIPVFWTMQPWGIRIFWYPPVQLSRVFLVSCSTFTIAKENLSVGVKQVVKFVIQENPRTRLFQSGVWKGSFWLWNSKRCIPDADKEYWNTLWYVFILYTTVFIKSKLPGCK